MTIFLARLTGSGAVRPGTAGDAAATTAASSGAVPSGPGSAGPVLAGTGRRPIGQWAYAGVAVTAFGGPLALAALYAPSIAGGASSSAGLGVLLAAAMFGFPLAVWFGYARHVSSSGGLYAFTEAAAGRRLALAQAGLWALSYTLYLVYTTAQIVYDTLPAVLPGERRYQTLLEVLIPVAVAGVMIAGRRVALVVIGLLAAGQLAVAAALSGVTLANVPVPAGSFGASAPAGSLAIASGQTALLYICGSLPFFLGGELGGDLRRAFTVTRRGLGGAYLVTAALIVAAVAPLAADPALLHTPIPGMAVAEQFAGHGFAVTVGIGVAVSVGGVVLVEYLALSRLTVAVTGWPLRRVLLGIGVVMVAAAPVLLINPDKIYDNLLTPSLFALWLSELVTFAVYPQLVARRGGRLLPAVLLASAASALAVYGLWVTIQTTSV
jgi:amino acid transporter